MSKHIERRDFLKLFGAGAAGVTAALTGCKPKAETGPIKDDYSHLQEAHGDLMTYRTTPTTGDKVVSKNGGFAIYNGTAWEGTLATLVPGQGYVYVAKGNTAQTVNWTKE